MNTYDISAKNGFVIDAVSFVLLLLTNSFRLLSITSRIRSVLCSCLNILLIYLCHCVYVPLHNHRYVSLPVLFLPTTVFLIVVIHSITFCVIISLGDIQSYPYKN